MTTPGSGISLVQRQLPSKILSKPGYVGTKGTHLNMKTTIINPLIPQADGTLVRRYPGFGNINGSEQFGNSTYHSLQLTLRRRWARSTLQAVYTKSKDLTSGDESSRFNTAPFPVPWNDYSRGRGPANFDRPQRLAITFSRSAQQVLEGTGPCVVQQLVAERLYHRAMGIPLSVVNRDSGAGLGGTIADVTGNFLSNVVAGASLIHPTGSTKDNLRTYINKDAFVKAPVGTFGNSGRGMFRGPGQVGSDLSVFKDFKLTERSSPHYCTEFFNLLNHANFALGRRYERKLTHWTSQFVGRVHQHAGKRQTHPVRPTIELPIGSRPVKPSRA